MYLIKKFYIDPIPESLKKSLELEDKFKKSLAPILHQQEQTQRIVNATNINIHTPALAAVKEFVDNNSIRAIPESIKTFQLTSGVRSAMEALRENSEKLALKVSMPSYQFEIPQLRAIEEMNKKIVSNLATGLTSLVQSPAIKQIQAFSSAIGSWLQSIDFTPLISILKSIQTIGFDHDYKEVHEVFLKAMLDSRWFPYAGWIADFRMVDAILEILDTSRASKNRIKRIDKLIFSFYDEEQLKNLKRGWRRLNLPSYMTRILIQSIQAYHRREYALTVSALTALWEGIIQEKANDKSYRISRKTRDNLSKLIEENEFDKIFSSFCDEFIFYDCMKPEDVKPDVPGRHGIAHCWYETYPNRKVALNAILFTDFLLRLKPLENQMTM